MPGRINGDTIIPNSRAAVSVIEEVFENQRITGPLFSSWKPPFLPTDRFECNPALMTLVSPLAVLTCPQCLCLCIRNNWTTCDGKAMTMEAINKSLPSGWQWDDDWYGTYCTQPHDHLSLSVPRPRVTGCVV